MPAAPPFNPADPADRGLALAFAEQAMAKAIKVEFAPAPDHPAVRENPVSGVRHAFVYRDAPVPAPVTWVHRVDPPTGTVMLHPLLPDGTAGEVSIFPLECDGTPFERARAKQRAVPEDFVHLHNHSQFSLLDGASTIEGMVERAEANGQRALALTDHGVMSGLWKFSQECQARGIKAIPGNELYVVDQVEPYEQTLPDGTARKKRFEYHQTVLAMNETGWRNLCRLTSLAWGQQYYYVGRVTHEQLFAHSEGLIVLSGCFKGMAPWALQKFEPLEGDVGPMPHWYNQGLDRAVDVLRRYREVFGDRFYGEVMNVPGFDRYMAVMPELIGLFDDLGMKTCLSTDAHYERAEDAEYQAMMTRVSKDKVDDLGDRATKTGPHYIASMTEIDRLGGLFREEFFANTAEIADRCDLELDTSFQFPRYDVEADPDWAAYRSSKRAAEGFA